jgi:hypothetical protein
MPEWIGILLPFAVFAVFFVALRRSATQRKIDIPKRRLRLAHVLVPAFTLGAILLGVAANVSPVVVFVLILVGIVLIMGLLRRNLTGRPS